jgi:hypothetical protein
MLFISAILLNFLNDSLFFEYIINMNKHIKQYSPLLEAIEVSDTPSAPVDLINKLTLDALNSIFMKKDNSVILLRYDEPGENPIYSAIADSSDSHGYASSDPFEVGLDCLYIGSPELDEKLKSFGLRRFKINFDLATGASYTSWSDPGDRYTPGDSGTDLTDESTEILNIVLNGEEVDLSLLSDEFIELLSGYGYDDIHHDLTKNGKKLIP